MDIDELSTHRRSILLAKAMGWKPVPYADDCASWLKMEPVGATKYRLIHPERMNMFVGIETAEGKRVSIGDQPYDDDNLERHWRRCPDFYKRKNMHLAWDVARWCNLNSTQLPNGKAMGRVFQSHCDAHFLWGESGAQGAWLDRVLQLSIEAGLITP